MLFRSNTGTKLCVFVNTGTKLCVFANTGTKLCVFANTGTKLCVFANTGTVFIYLGPIQLRQVQHTKVLSSTEESQST